MAETAFLGENLIVWLLLALGGALFAGNLMALVRPPAQPRDEGDLERAPRDGGHRPGGCARRARLAAALTAA
jgi:hypothetical protein